MRLKFWKFTLTKKWSCIHAKTEVWLKEKGLAHEDQLAQPQDTLENLQKECYAQFGINLLEVFQKLEELY